MEANVNNWEVTLENIERNLQNKQLRILALVQEFKRM